MSAVRRVAFALAPLLALLLAGELLFRLFPHRDRGDTRSDAVVPDPQLVWRLRPVADGPWATNALGLRDDPFEADAALTVLVLGDSVAWGDGLRMEFAFPFLLEQRLRARGGGRSAEVINASVPGYSTFQQATWLRLHGLPLDPDLVVLQFCLNDVVERYRTFAEWGGDNVFLGVDTREAVRGVRGVLLRRSRLFEGLLRALQQLSRRREEYEVERMARDSWSQELEEAWLLTRAELDEVHALARQGGVPLWLLIAPYRFQLETPEAPQALRQPQDRLLAWARERGVRAFDLLPRLVALAEANQLAPEALFIDANHFSIPGHEVAAEELARAIATWQGWGSPQGTIP